MLVNIENELNNPIVCNLVSESAWDKSEEAAIKRMAEFRNRDDLILYGWIENKIIIGVTGVVVHADYIEINNIAVSPEYRKRGIGFAMITTLRDMYKSTLKAETDEDAVDFYIKCGFAVEEFTKVYNGTKFKRYNCILPFE